MDKNVPANEPKDLPDDALENVAGGLRRQLNPQPLPPLRCAQGGSF